MITTDAFGNKVWKVNYCVIEFSRNNRFTPKPADIKIHLYDSDFDSNGTATLDINGLRADSLYNAYTMDSSIPSEVDAIYNTILFRTKDSSTAIDNIEATPEHTTDDKTYNLAEQEVRRMTNGIYIKNGRKIICNPSK